MKNKRHNTSLWQRWGMRALTLLLACALTAGLALTATAATGDFVEGEVVVPAIPKPVVTIQGNLVTEKGKPTGFYELALCVRSGRTITANANNPDITPGTVVTEADYAAYLAAHPGVAEDPTTVFDIQYYPFRTASSAMHINTDILTAVNWNIQSVTYEPFDPVAGYPSDATVAPGAANYPRGIDTDPTVQGYDPATLPEWDAFPDITTPNLGLDDPLQAAPSVALDVEGDPRMSTVEGVAENWKDNDALITLSASAPDNYPVILKDSTPLVVARFAYDLKRFDTTKVSEALGTGNITAQRNSITGDPGAKGLWMGWDMTTGHGDANFVNKDALTWLGQSTGTFDFTDSDEQAESTQVGQSVWVHTGTNQTDAPDTYYYYYLAAETDPATNAGTVKVYDKATGTTQEVKDVALPDTVGHKVLTPGTDRNPTATPMANYTYFKNLLSLQEETLIVKLVNEPTFKRPTGAGGKTILFYDWDNTLIGSMTVDKGDVRAEVEAYIEENLVHPDLRPGSAFMDDGAGNTDVNKLSSLERQYTYRGKYAYTLGGDDATLGVTDGKEYPLTNKLDYVFTKRVNTVLTQEESGEKVQYVHPYALNDPALDPTVRDNDAAEYPYVYGWAVVEDTRAFNGNVNAVGGATGPWKVMHDAAKIQGDNDVWTTIGVGELTNSKPTNALNTVAAVDPAAVRTAPAFLAGADVAWTDGTLGDDYAYTLTGAEKNSYLRFADFSDVTAEFNRYQGKDTLIVKAVYEPGEQLADAPYRISSNPYYNKFNGEAANGGGAYAIKMTVERANTMQADGLLRGSRRMRESVVRQDTTLDQKWIEDAVMGVDHDLSNPSIAIAINRTQTTYTKVDVDNGEEITFTLSLSARQNKVNYFLTDMYDLNFVTGGQRTDTNFNMTGDAHVIDNYNYLADDSDKNDAMYDRQGVYYQVPRFAVKDGSHGFVLYGTLNYIMEQATSVARGEMTRPDYNAIAGYAELTDMNLCLDGGTTVPSFGSEDRFNDAILDAAKDCLLNHQGDPDYWNNELDCAELTYHQLQHYLSGKGLMTRAAADADPIDWCHLHAACFKDPEAAAAPKDWNDIITFAADPAKADGIGLLTGGATGKVEELTFLRATANGDPFPAGSAFQAKIVEAVGKLNAAGQPLTWANIQYYIVEGLTPMGDQGINKALESYWWYNGALTKPTAPRNLTELAAGAKAYTSGATLKDGSHVTGWTFGLQGVTDIFLDNDSKGPDVVGSSWIRLTENLVASRVVNGPDDESTVKFATYTDFETALLDAMDVADQAGVDPAADTLYWHKLQYHIFHKDEPGYSFPDWATETDGSPQTTEMLGYWWHNGGKLYVVKDLQSMLEVAKLAAGGDTDAQNAWDKFLSFTNASGTVMSELLFSQDFKGTMYTDADIAAFKTQIQTMAALPDAPTLSVTDAADANMKNAVWTEIQYYLIHGSLDAAEANMESVTGYYWWKDGGSPTAPGITTWEDAFLAAFLEQVNGNTVAWDNLDANIMLMTSSRLRDYDAANPPADPIYEYSKLPKYTTADLKAAAIAYVTGNPAGGHGHTPATPTWFQLQHYLKNGSWDVSGISQDDLEKRYWWFDGKAEDPNKPKEALDKPLTDWKTARLASNTTINASKNTDFTAADINFKATTAGGAVTAANLATAKTRLRTLLTKTAAAGADKNELTWYQIQTALWPNTVVAGVGTVGNGAYVAPDIAAKAYHAKVTAAKDWRPQWAKDLYDETTGLPKAGLTAAGDIVLVDESVGADVLIGPETDPDTKNDLPNTTSPDEKNILPTTTTTTQALPDGGVVVTTVTTGVDGYVTTVTTHIAPGGVASTTTTITPPEEDADDVGADVPIGPETDAPALDAETEAGDRGNVGADVPIGPAPVAPVPEIPDPAVDPDMETATPETPEGEDAAAGLRAKVLASPLGEVPSVSEAERCPAQRLGVQKTWVKAATPVSGHPPKPAPAGLTPLKGGQDAAPPAWRKSWWMV